MNLIKRSVLFFLAAVVLLLPMTAHPEGIDLKYYAISNLTEVLSYTIEEAAQFVFDETEDGTIAFWHPNHPAWIYTVYIDRETGQISCASPFDTGYYLFRGENTVRDLLRTVRESGWFADWNEEAHEKLLGLLDMDNIRISTELYFAQQGGNAVHGFFESLYGPEFGWTESLHQLYQSVMDEYSLARNPEQFHLSGIREIVHPQPSGCVRRLTLFEGEIPEAWQSVLADPHLEDWQCSSGAIVFMDWTQMENARTKSGSGLVIFEKDNRRQLIQLSLVGEEWKIYPLGEKALYQNKDCKVTYDGIHGSLAVVYQLNEYEQSSFFLVPRADNTGYSECAITAYERLNTEKKEAVWISVSPSGIPTWEREMVDLWDVPRSRFPYQIGAVPIDLFPTTLEEAKNTNYPGLPEGYAIVNSVNLRKKTSSRSHSYGELKNGVIIPALDILPGDPNKWIHTKLGLLEGYVASNYTSMGGEDFLLAALQPVAKAEKEITLKSGTGWFDTTVGTFPAGTRMHVVIENGEWLYVDIPRGEMNWLMDPEGIFGYVHKNDVIQASTACQLDWMEK